MLIRTDIDPNRRNVRPPFGEDLAEALARKVVGQPAAVTSIVPYLMMHKAGLAPEGRPVGVFLLLGPTGTGKTRTVEALAELTHGSAKNMIKVDCGEFQMEHEVAKLVGAPPGYLGHRETQPMLTQQKINGVASERSDLSLILFDEIEKAAPSMTRMLLGILDKAQLRLGDNNTVNFERTMIFLTSNLGAQAMQKQMGTPFGFEAVVHETEEQRCTAKRLEQIGLAAVRRRFSPEFVNRIDKVVTYKPLTNDDLAKILDHLLVEFQRLIDNRLGVRGFVLSLTPRGRKWLLKKGASQEYGARELKRTIHRHVIQPLAASVAKGTVRPGTIVRMDPREDKLVILPQAA